MKCAEEEQTRFVTSAPEQAPRWRAEPLADSMARSENNAGRRQAMSKFIHQSATLLGLLFLITLSGSVAAQTRPARTDVGAPVTSMLWVGNSFFYYNNSMHGHYEALARAGDPETRQRGVSVTISGSGLDWHDVASYLQPDLIGRYSFAPGNRIVFNKPGKQFDAVIMMDCSQCPIHPQLAAAFRATVKKDAAIVTQYGARPVLFMSWAYKDKPEMTAELAEQYTLAGNANDALVIPAGLAFAKATVRRPELELYQPDKRHPTLAGTYLAACTTYAAILKKSPIGNTYHAGLDPELAAFLQSVAADTVQEYYARPGP
jgi:hypothetical protein